MARKSVTKNVRFEYYQVTLEIREKAIEQQLAIELQQQHKDKETTNYLNNLLKHRDEYTTKMDLTEMLSSIHTKELKDTIDVVDKLIQLDTLTFYPKQNTFSGSDHIYFQLSNCRQINLPSKVSPDKPRTAITLADNEYIGEFMGLYFYRPTCTLMIQCNKYALSISQVEDYLNSIRIKYLEKTERWNADESIKSIVLRPVLDPALLMEIKNGRRPYTKLSIIGSDTSLQALTPNESSALYEFRQALEKIRGTKFELVLYVDSRTVNGKSKFQSLDSKRVEEVFDQFNALPEYRRPKVETTTKDLAHNQSHTLNWALPMLKSIIQFKLTPQFANVSVDLLYEKMKEEFKRNESTIIAIAGEFQL